MRQARIISLSLPSSQVSRTARPAIERRLGSIMGLDVKGYSLMMSNDEEDTHQRIGLSLEQVVGKIQRRHGRVFSFAGDGLMAEFSNPVLAVRCALQVQSDAAKQNARLPSARRIEYRIGVHSGEILVQSDRTGSEAVNIAARLEEIGEPGTVYLSGSVYEQVRKIVPGNYYDLGWMKLKNIPNTINVYCLAPNKPGGGHDGDQSGGRSVRQSVGSAIPTVAVLPLQNLSENQADSYFSDGIVEDIIVSLSGLRELIVVSRASTQVFANSSHSFQDVGRILGARYILTGSVRQTVRAMRVAVQLNDADTGTSLWADASDVAPGDLFDVQDKIVRRVVSGIAPQIREEELRRVMRRRPDSMTAYHYTLRALHCMNTLTRESFFEARALFSKAIEEDADFAMPVAWCIWCIIVWIGQGWSEDPSQDRADALGLAERVVTLDPRNALALAMHGHMRSFLFRNYDTALVYLERARAAGPSSAIAALMHALTLAYVGRGAQSVAAAKDALRFSPLDPNMFLFHNTLALAHYSAGLLEEAAVWAQSSANLAPMFKANVRTLIAILESLGRHEEALNLVANYLATEPDFSLEHYARTIQPFGDASLRAQFLKGLRAAGLPD